MKLGSVICLLFFSWTLGLAQEIHYTIRFPNVAHHEAEIEARFENAPATLELHMSRSSPGRYAMHEFARNVYGVRITDGAGKALTPSRPSVHEWNVTGHDGTVIVRYTLFGDRADGTYAAIDPARALLNAPATLMWARGLEQRPSVVTVEPPSGSRWKVATQLAPVSEFVFRAPHRDYLLDSPVLAGNLALREWKAGDQSMRLALQHTGTEEEATALARIAEVIVNEEEGVFGELPRFDFGTYTFLVDLMPQSSGDGMEHRNSTVISGSRSIRESHTGPIETIAHEFWHCWNVERIRPRTLEPFRFDDTNISGELWFAEGFTSYYAPLVMRRAGLTSLESFARSLAGSVSAALTGPGREMNSPVEMSRLAPFADGASNGMAPDNLRNIFISYYPYGAAVGLGVDLSIRSEFPGKSLDDWMRAMWTRFGSLQKDYAPAKPYTLEDLEDTLASVTSREFAAAMFRKHIRGTEPIGFAKLLEKAGLLLREPPDAKPWLGAGGVRFADNGMSLTTPTVRGGPLYEAGLDRGDRIVDMEGRKLRAQNDLDAILHAKKPGDSVKVKVATRTGDAERTIRLAATPGYEIKPFEQAGRTLSTEQRAFRESWLASKAKRPSPEVHRYCPKCRRALSFSYENCPYDGTDLEIALPAH